MVLPVQVSRILRSLGFLQRHQTYGHFINVAQRAACLLSSVYLVTPMIYAIIVEARTTVDIVQVLMNLMCGLCTIGFYSVLLLNRRPILNVLDRLQLKLDERMVFFIDFCYTIQVFD